MVSPRLLSKKAMKNIKCSTFLHQKSKIAFLGGGLGEPLFGHQRAVPPETLLISVSLKDDAAGGLRPFASHGRCFLAWKSSSIRFFHPRFSGALARRRHTASPTTS